jgi:hypothetical protein
MPYVQEKMECRCTIFELVRLSEYAKAYAHQKKQSIGKAGKKLGIDSVLDLPIKRDAFHLLFSLLFHPGNDRQKLLVSLWHPQAAVLSTGLLQVAEVG